MLKKAILIIAGSALIVFAICSVVPKYEVYVSGGDGTVTYRFNKITGEFESITDGKWKKESTFLFGIRHPGTFKSK
jgi:hypothetical protein